MRVSVFCSLERGSLNMWRVNTTIHTITPAVAVAMRTGDWDCMPLIVWAVHFSWAHEADSWFGGIHVCLYAAISGVRTGPCCCETSPWNLESFRPFTITGAETIQPFIPHQRLVLFFCTESVRPLQLVSCLSFFLKVAVCGALHMIPVWSCCREMHLFCGDVKH